MSQDDYDVYVEEDESLPLWKRPLLSYEKTKQKI